MLDATIGSVPVAVRIVDRIHGSLVFPRRVRVLVGHLADLIPQGARVLDVGSGDGLVAASLLERRDDLSLQGIDVLVRPAAHIPVQAFDGETIPFPDESFDAALLVDVVHHAERPLGLLAEAKRVAGRCVVIKDHVLEGPLAASTLRFMDWVGNARYGVALPHSYWPKDRWLEAAAELGLEVDVWRSSLGLYPRPANLLFDRSLHFVARLNRADSGQV